MEIIRSYENKKIKHASKLKDKAYRDETAQYFAEGVKWVGDALKYSAMPDIVDYILVKETKISEYASNFGGFEKVYCVDDAIFDKISDTKNNQGVLAVLNMVKYNSVPSGDNVLYLDRVRDPGNMGTIIRTACAAGYDEIICDNCVDVYNPKVVRSCMSAILHVDIYVESGITIDDLKKSGYAVLTADARGQNIFGINDVPSKTALVIGNEANGVSREIAEKTDILISIPMSENIESLNAAVSAAVLMYNLKITS